MKKKIQANSLFFKIICTVIVGLVCLTVVLSMINITVSKEVFLYSFSESQEKIFSQIDQEFYDFYKDIIEVTSEISSSESIQNYLLDQSTYSEETHQILKFKQQLKETKLSEHQSLDLLLVGVSGKTYSHDSGELLVESADEILKDEVSVAAIEQGELVICKYRKKGFTDVTSRDPVIVFAKAIRNTKDKELIGIAYLIIKEEEISHMYDYFTSETSDIVLFNQDKEVISSNNKSYLKDSKIIRYKLEELMKGEENQKSYQKTKESKTYFMQNLQSTNYRILGVIDPEVAFMKQYGLKESIALTLFVTIIIVIIIFFLIKQQTDPLSQIVRKMERVSGDNLNEYVEVRGTEEVRKLSETYNRMIKALNEYVKKLVEIEEEKRMAEIYSLQMQINPHYLYNTLASIKVLIRQSEIEKSIKMMNAFIALLRNTISNTDEFITVSQEIENLENYVYINQIRYGDKIQVEFFVALNCRHYFVPKLILQPFIENAFFHGFPEDRTGQIAVYVREERGYLKFEIVDNGVGIKTEQLQRLQTKEKRKSIHFTGIGINNVDERIKLIYGMDYGIHIKSEEKQGTTIILLLPRKEE